MISSGRDTGAPPRQRTLGKNPTADSVRWVSQYRTELRPSLISDKNDRLVSGVPWCVHTGAKHLLVSQDAFIFPKRRKSARHRQVSEESGTALLNPRVGHSLCVVLASALSTNTVCPPSRRLSWCFSTSLFLTLFLSLSPKRGTSLLPFILTRTRQSHRLAGLTCCSTHLSPELWALTKRAPRACS